MKRIIFIGIGVQGKLWCDKFLPPLVKDKIITIAAVADPVEENLAYAKKALGLSDEQCFKSYEEAIDKCDADFVVDCAPPAIHEPIADAALAKNLDIYSEKPVAHTLESAVRIALKVKEAGLKMGINMSFRFDREYYTLFKLLQSGECGPVNYISGHLTTDCRKFGSWGTPYRHEMDEPLLLDGLIHQLDLYGSLAGSKCRSVYAQSWNPEWGEYKNGSNVLLNMKYENGVRAIFEASKTSAVGLSHWANVGPWPGEYHRVECRDATVILNRREIELFRYDPDKVWHQELEGTGEKVELLKQKYWNSPWLLKKFIDWLNGGEMMETNVDDNLQSMAVVFAAIKSSRKDCVVDVQQLLGDVVKKEKEAMQ